ncbi:MAG TPA: DUF721 domain-containing protein [Acidimicrobiales bacterium]|nr:DUF721 domain-containing protein [Acidimicrobiales bacterium]
MSSPPGIPPGPIGWDGRTGDEPSYRDRQYTPGPRRLGESLSKVAKLMGVSGGVETISVVFAHWSEVVGEAVAQHATPISIKGSTLKVGVDHPSWATQLRLLSSTLLTKVQELTGEGRVTDIEIVVRPKSGPAPSGKQGFGRPG